MAPSVKQALGLSAAVNSPTEVYREVPFVALPRQYEEEREAILNCVDRVFRRGVFVSLAHLEELESRLADACGVRHSIGVGSGTDALFLILKGYGVGEGDEVITPPNSHFSTTSSIIHAGAVPVFADVGDDQSIDPARVEAAITPRTRAIMPVHLTGRIADMAAITDIARRHGLLVIEDAAQAFGAKQDGRAAGSFGDAAAFSAHPLKVFNAAGDAGFITTGDGELAARLRSLRNNGLKGREQVDEWGYAARLDVLQGEFLLMRLDRLPDLIARRRANVASYRARLNKTHVYFPEDGEDQFSVFQNFVIQVERRDALKDYLADRGIKTAIHYPVPIHLQPAARSLGYGNGDFPVTERQAGRILSLPVHPYLSPGDIDYVTEAVNSFFESV